MHKEHIPIEAAHRPAHEMKGQAGIERRTKYSSQMRGILCMDTRARSYVLFREATAGSVIARPRTALCRSCRYACQSCAKGK